MVTAGPKKKAGFTCGACKATFKQRDKFEKHPCTKNLKDDESSDDDSYVTYTLKPENHPLVKILKQKTNRAIDVYRTVFREKWAISGLT